MEREPLERALVTRAAELGFARCAVAQAGRLARDGEALGAWVDAGRHAGMSYMAREPERRADPERLLPGCRAVIVLAANYWPGEERARTPSGKARVALYAQGRDYHRVLGPKLKTLAAWLDGESGSISRTFVDTGPVLERAWAERAGLGWIGKNANLLTRDLGSWLLLGEILTTAALRADPGPHPDFCGSCTACLDACPTGAILEAGVVDANRCISYWTIEHRGAVPAERRGDISDWIFGCDVCQDVCPWNRSFAREDDARTLAPREELWGLDPVDVLGLDEGRFRARYSGTALMRAKWEGMRRNACIVLGNRGRQADLAPLGRALEDPDAVVAGHAAWAVARIGGPEAARLLAQALAREARPAVRLEIEQGLERLRPGPPAAH